MISEFKFDSNEIKLYKDYTFFAKFNFFLFSICEI